MKTIKNNTRRGFALVNAIVIMVTLAGLSAFVVGNVSNDAPEAATDIVNSTKYAVNCTAVNEVIASVAAIGTLDEGWDAAIKSGDPVAIVSKLRSGVTLYGTTMVKRLPVMNPADFAGYRWDAANMMILPPA